MDIEELKRLHAERYSGYRCNAAWLTAVESNFPAIVAKLEAAQRLRDAMAQLLEDGVWPTRSGIKSAETALAAFDKETA